MQKMWIAAILTSVAAAGSGAQKRPPDIVVFVHADSAGVSAFGAAEGRAAKMLAAAGVSVAWRLGKPNYRGPAEVIEAVLTTRTDENFRPGALAYATIGPQSGIRIVVFYDRILHDGINSSAPILAHVLVHEITHILEGVERHSAYGVMKATWEGDDWMRMHFSGLPFADEDLQLIHLWSARHNRNLVAGLH
jgi:hypothetical protein